MSECTLWTGAVSKNGYGTLRVDGVTVYAHRHAYESAHGPIPVGAQVDHVWERGCRSRLCVNPEHLEAVTQQENIRRQFAARFEHDPETHCCHGHRWQPATTRIDRHGRKVCRTCMRDYQRAYRARRHAEPQSAVA